MASETLKSRLEVTRVIQNGTIRKLGYGFLFACYAVSRIISEIIVREFVTFCFKICKFVNFFYFVWQIKLVPVNFLLHV